MEVEDIAEDGIKETWLILIPNICDDLVFLFFFFLSYEVKEVVKEKIVEDLFSETRIQG